MNPCNPKITVQVADLDTWLVRLEYQFSEGEHLDFALRLTRDDSTLTELEATALQRLVMMAEALTPPTPPRR